MIEEAIIELLLTIPGVTGIVGQRIYPNIIKEGTQLPAMYVAANRMSKMNCDNPMGIKTGVVEIGVHGAEYWHCSDTIMEMRKVLDDYAGKVSNVGLTFNSGEEVADGWDDDLDTHVKIIEYEGYAIAKSTN
ncbi:hypothetical protein J2Y45_002122 [Dyadobacter sp. BE34]|uniref:DUF3168 domain-containing protein n=1 Tax=Dyadobacter fermentans TaxID=94254 RepID=A0ABU1QY24_9BACT|nr:MULTISPECIES: hypothetical protein [Dyadobacter]MDR6805569.1 hypothetical protein [Dyadobacter fermentans]MDR7042671.1 hypothetical protein [Dyadobacter sp. BE242]MDR7196983.1 hypothetical protein [Dyadobacter sp. BE34]MDR7215582.1 hypothetical protein [Dyadobacter sp. BE31]MDR7263118.1 hypothetical protein [Dyadobacter sp. BE32]